MKSKLLRLFMLSFFITMISCSNTEETESQVIEEIETEIEEPEEEPEEMADPNETTTIDGIKYGENFIVFEPEVTKSDLGLWVKRIPGDSKYHVGTGIEALNKGYLEFTGNNLNGGTAKSPLAYTFNCQKTAKYRIVMRMYQPLLDGEAGDKRNDLWIKLTGDYTTACIYPTADLKSDHKFWGRGVRKWGSIHKLEGHVDGVKKLANVIYNLKKDESYTFTMSVRAQGCSIDYVLLFETSLDVKIENHTDLAAELPELYRPNINE